MVDTGPVATCGDGFRCIAELGAPWMGPVALGNTCQGTYPDETSTLLSDLVQPTASCTCQCAASATCSSTFRFTAWADDTCTTFEDFLLLEIDVCEDTFVSQAVEAYSIDLDDPVGSCAPGTVSENLPQASFGREVKTCGGFSPGPDACGPAATCAPEPDGALETGICYVAQGDVACPSGFPDRTVYATGTEDGRRCPSSCSCSPQGAVCSVEIERFGDDQCDSPRSSSTLRSDEGEVCLVRSGDSILAQTATLSLVNAGQCVPESLSVTGAVLEAGLHTVCCS